MAEVHQGADEGGQHLLTFFYSNPLVYEYTDEESGRVVKKEVGPLDHEEVWLPSRKYETGWKMLNQYISRPKSCHKRAALQSSLFRFNYCIRRMVVYGLTQRAAKDTRSIEWYLKPNYSYRLQHVPGIRYRYNSSQYNIQQSMMTVWLLRINNRVCYINRGW